MNHEKRLNITETYKIIFAAGAVLALPLSCVCACMLYGNSVTVSLHAAATCLAWMLSGLLFSRIAGNAVGKDHCILGAIILAVAYILLTMGIIHPVAMVAFG